MRPGDARSPPPAFWPRTASPGGPTTVAGPARGYFCQICRLHCSGPEPWRQHIDSARHMKLERDLRARGAAGAADGSPASPGSPLAVSDSDSPTPSPSRRPPGAEARPFFCETCQLGCSGPEPWRQHLQSAKHLKRSSLEQAAGGVATGQQSVEHILGSGGSPALPSAPPAGGSGGSFYCQYCRLSCSGREPWRQHENSAKHLKKKAQAEAAGFWSPPSADPVDDRQSPSVASDSAPAAVPQPVDHSFHCAACSITCYGAEPWRQHTESGRHLKLTAEAARREIGGGSQAVSDSPQPSGRSTPASLPGRQYYCELCRVGCSGPEPYKQHVQSAKHIKMAADHCASAPAPGPELVPEREPELVPEPESVTMSEVSSSSSSMETAEALPWPSTNPFNPFLPSAVSDGAASSKDPLSAVSDVAASSTDPPSASSASFSDPPSASSASAAAGDGSGVPSPAPRDWEWVPSTPSERSAVTGAGEALIPLAGSSASGRSTPASGLSSGRATPARGPATPAFVGVIGGGYRCNVCQIDCTGPESLRQHLGGTKHLKMLASSPRADPGASANCVDSLQGAGPASPAGWLSAGASPAGPSALLDPCRSIRLGSQLHDLLDRKDGISEHDSLTAADCLRRLHPEGLVAFLEDIPLVRCNQPFSRARC
ncbi:zinc finger RNA-binding protein-like isoform X2 [Amphibalanus amphitrite]|uniref:zinc finger RNA-binding protein-like isoform X2 n=1 Tax=Amphibalanus amphitrite TaxID=1232801 RepID=UPI001C9262B3|nr:zinc finger RNA-binding protein-like isoform X2 [Amphibalanus amphitrite]